MITVTFLDVLEVYIIYLISVETEIQMLNDLDEGAKQGGSGSFRQV